MVALFKVIFVFNLVLASLVPAHAGFIGWVTSRERSWDFIQQTGGIRIGQPVERDGTLMLPVDYDASGTTGITTRPTIVTSGQAVRRINVSRARGDQLVLTVVTQILEATSDSGRLHYADLSHITAGTYDVFYEKGGQAEQLLGRVTIP